MKILHSEFVCTGHSRVPIWIMELEWATSRLARPVAGAPKDARKDVRLPVDHVGFSVAAIRDQPDVLRDRRMRGAGELAIHHLVEVIGRRKIGGLH
jgi:hypothetical protein